MASLTGNLVAETYKALLKTIDNDILTASEKQITDGLGGGSNVFIDSNGFLRANKYKVTNGLATQFLKADGSLDANTYLTGITSSQIITALGYTPVPTTRTLTINGTTYDLSANRSWTVAGTAAVWGNITGTLSNQTDLQTALNAKFNNPTGTISQYIRGDGSLATFPTITGGLPIGGTAGQILAKIDATDYNTHWIDNFATQTKNEVKLGATLAKGTAVYVSGSTGGSGTNMIVMAASNASEALSSKTFGLLETGGATNDFVKCVTFGLIAGLDTSTAQAGDPVWLGINGALLFGLANKPVAPANMVYIGVVTRVQSNNGEIFVNVQNGFEIEELHDVLITSKANNQGLFYESSTGLWKNKSIATVLGYTPQAQLNGTGFVKASGTTISYDNSTYLTTADAASTYQRLDRMAINLLASDIQYPNNNAVIAALALKANAANPEFTGNMTISGAEPKLFFTDTDNNPDYTVFIDSGVFFIYDQTAGTTRFSISSTGNISSGVGKSITAGSFVKESGTAAQFLKADGSIDSNSYLSLSGGTMTGAITTPNGTFGIIIGDDSRIADRNIANTLFLEGVQNNDRGYINFSQTTGNALGAIDGGALTWRGANVMTSANISGTTNYLSKFTSANVIGNSQIFDNGTSVGINTATPNSNFVLDVAARDVSYNTRFYQPSSATTSYNSILISGAMTSAVAYFGIGGSTTGNTSFRDTAVIGTQSSHDLVFNTSDAQKMRLFTTGNLLIGTSATDSGFKLDVLGTIRVTGAASFSNSVTATSFVRVSGTATQFLKADGTIDSSTYLTTAGAAAQYQPIGTYPTGSGESTRLARWTSTSNLSVAQVWDDGTNVGIGQSPGAFKLDVTGTLRANRIFGNYTTVLDTYTTVNPSTNVILASPPNDRDAWIYRDQADGSSNWGIYHRQIDSAIANLPANSIGFIGAGTNTLQAYIALATGNGYFAGNLLLGTTTDSGNRLDVNGAVRVQGSNPSYRTDNATNYTSLVSYLNGTRSWQLDNVGNEFWLYLAGTINTYVLKIAATTGIATFSNGINANGDILTGLSSSSYQTTNRRVIVANGTSTSLFGLVVGGVNKGYFYSTGTNIILMSEDAAGYMSFGTANAERIRISNTGVLALNGSSAPNSGGLDKFSLGFQDGVDGWLQTWGGRPLSLNSQGNNVLIGTRTDNGQAYLQIGNTNANKISLTGGSSQNGMRWESVGGANTFYLFNGTINSAGWGLYNVTTGVFPIWASNGGNISIGTTVDNGLGVLQVNGNIILAGGSSSGQSQLSSGFTTLRFPNQYSSGFTDAGVKLFIFNSGATIQGFTAGPAYDLQYHSSGSSSGRHAFYVGNTEIIRFNQTTVVSTGSITATSFFESSDIRLKKLIEHNPIINGIENLQAKLYEKGGKIELGYFAQDAEKLMPYAVTKNPDGFLNLSYREVHTAKIARLEKRVAELEKQLNLN